jgi:LysM repeat protein
MENPTDDLHSALSDAFSQAEAQEKPVETVVDEPASGPARDDAGRFAAKPVEAAVAPVEPVAAPVTEVAPPRKAPSSWKPEAQAAYLKAAADEPLTPAEVKLLTQEAERRESDYHKGIEQYKTHAHEAQAYQRVVEPYMQTIRSLGVDAPTAIAKLFQADHTLRYSDPATKARFLGQLAQEYGVDIGQVQNAPPVDPNVQYLQQQLQQQQQWIQQVHQQQEMREQAGYQSEIEKFKADPANTHFEAVKEEMALLLQTGKAQDLKSAYDTAVWMRADIRQSLVEQQRAEAQRSATEQAQATRAKSAAVSVKGSSPAGGGVQPVKGSLRDQIEAAISDAS